MFRQQPIRQVFCVFQGEKGDFAIVFSKQHGSSEQAQLAHIILLALQKCALYSCWRG